MKFILNSSLINKKLIILVFTLFSFINSEIINIELKDEIYSKNLIINPNSEYCKFKVKGTNDYNYLKIKVEGKDEQEINHVISYYQGDSTFNDRKQLSQSITDTTIMWLTKEQIKNDFYFGIECAKYPCNFKVDIITSSNAELEIDEQYTYYVTPENKIMNFIIKGNEHIESLNNLNDYILTLWAIGSKEIKSNLEGGISEKPIKRAYYRVSLSDFNNTVYKLTIEGENGDLITIGSLLFKYEDNKESSSKKIFISESVLKYNGIEIFGYIKSNEIIRLQLNEYRDNLESSYDLDNKPGLSDKISYNDYYCYAELNGKDNFFSYKFLEQNNCDGQGNNKHSPQLLGVNNLKLIEKGGIAGFIPMILEENFNFFTYDIINLEIGQEISAFIYKCENYPLCTIDNNILEKSEKMVNYKTGYSYILSKDEWKMGKNPINKKQNMLLIKCEKTLSHENKCCFIFSMKTDNTIINLFNDKFEENPIYKYIRKNNENKYLLKTGTRLIGLNIITFSGSIEISINLNKNYQVYENNNQKLYIFLKKEGTYSETTEDYIITIKGKENSIYSISDNYYDLTNEDIMLITGGNYFVNLIKNLTLFQSGSYEIEKNYYMGIYPLDCKIEVKIMKNNKTLTEKNGFYQDISNNIGSKYYLSNLNNSNSCLLYISYFELDDKNGISLTDNTSQLFAFNPDYKKLQFSYIHTQIDNDININLGQINEGKYKIDFYLNDKEFDTHNNISLITSNKTIEIKSTDIKSTCKDSKNICKLFLYIESQDSEKESILEIKVANNKNDQKNNNEKEPRQFDIKTFIYIGVGVFVLIIIIIIIIVLIRAFVKKKDLENTVNKISFIEDNRKNDDDDDDNENILLP